VRIRARLGQPVERKLMARPKALAINGKIVIRVVVKEKVRVGIVKVGRKVVIKGERKNQKRAERRAHMTGTPMEVKEEIQRARKEAARSI
jgi:hypothetical protein